MKTAIEDCKNPIPGTEIDRLLQAPFDWEFLIRICQHLELDGPTPHELIRYGDQRCNELLRDGQLLLEDEIGYRNDKADMVKWQKKHDKWQLRETKQAVKSVVLSQFNQWSKKTRLRSQRRPQGRPDPNEEDTNQENTAIDDCEVEERGRPFRWRCP